MGKKKKNANTTVDKNESVGFSIDTPEEAEPQNPKPPQQNKVQSPPVKKIIPPTTIPKQIKQIIPKPSTDKEDQCMCLSMHQPWASLLVFGIKKLEGRSWHSEFRGRLWIASTVQEPDSATITEIEMQYSGFVRKAFPVHYPCGVLLGCVDVVDVISQDEHQARQQLLPENERTSEENGSSYLFVCENARQLIMPFPVKGDHKIWKLPKKTVDLAQKGLKEI